MNKALFVSFASADETPVRTLTDTLERNGVLCWVSYRDVTPAANWSLSIIDAIDDCQAMLLVLSKASNESIHVANEVERAVSKGKILYVVRIEDVKPSRVMELHVSSRQWTDAFRLPIDTAIQALAGSIREKLGIIVPSLISQAAPGANSTASATSKLEAFAAKIASRGQTPGADPMLNLDVPITEALAQFNVSESGSMGSFYMDEGNARQIYRILREKLHGVADQSIRSALERRLTDADPLTKWKVMKLLLMLGQIDARIARSYWEAQPRWIPRQLVFDALKILPVTERMTLLSEIAQLLLVCQDVRF